MDIAQAVQNIRQHLEAVKADVEAKLEQDLPGLESWAHAASANPAVAALSAAVHLPEVPEVLQGLAAFIASVDAALGAAKAAAAQQPDVPAAA